MERLIWVLGLCGLLPMAAGLLAPVLPGGAALQSAAMAYGGIIAAFMAGTHWAFAAYSDAAPAARLIAAVSLALVAWLLLFAPRPWAGFALAAVFFALFAMDGWMARRGLHHPEYWRLRQVLTAGAALCYIGLALSPPA